MNKECGWKLQYNNETQTIWFESIKAVMSFVDKNRIKSYSLRFIKPENNIKE